MSQEALSTIDPPFLALPHGSCRLSNYGYMFAWNCVDFGQRFSQLHGNLCGGSFRRLGMLCKDCNLSSPIRWSNRTLESNTFEYVCILRLWFRCPTQALLGYVPISQTQWCKPCSCVCAGIVSHASCLHINKNTRRIVACCLGLSCTV